MDSILFNPEYHLRQDGNRVILFSDDDVSDKSEEWFSFIHPYHAMMFSFFDGKNKSQDEIEACAQFFHLPLLKMKEIVAKFLNRGHWFTIRSGKHFLNFPKNLLIQVETGTIKRKDYPSPNSFSYSGDPDYNTLRLRKEEYVSTHKEKAFQERALCTGGTRSAVLLPNGDMTICEELYDHPAFILGNVRKKTIKDIWNSPKAASLYQAPTDSQSTSPCKKCSSRTTCRTGAGVCWKLVIMAYGHQHWDYPDPRCPKAPKFLKDFYYE